MSAADWDAIADAAARTVEAARSEAESAPHRRTRQHYWRNVFFEGDVQERGGQWNARLITPPRAH